jgi:xanthine dehydrogenase accessory factor
VHRELELWQFVGERLERREAVMLLVVAESSGSSPGRAGYKMAVAADGELAGSIGGGVMEVDLVEQSRAILGTRASLSAASRDGVRKPISEQVHKKNAVNASGMICSGKQTVIFKLLLPDDLEDVRRAADSLKTQQQDRLIITPEEFKVLPRQDEAPSNADIHFERSTGSEFVYQERLGHKNILYIIGGGHCALALSELMSKMDFAIHIFDDRPELNTIAKNRFADRISIIESYENIGDHITPAENAYVVVMTLGYASDEVVIRKLLGRPFKYFGVLGSKAKMKTLLNELKKDGSAAEQIDAIHSPIGLPINSRTPEEIAVSIAAEIISVKNG